MCKQPNGKFLETVMPIYEFRCLKCNECFELLQMGGDDVAEARCPKCGSEEFERIMSAAAYAMGTGKKGVSAQTRTCSSGSCTTWDVPGPA